jgi:hypothetical protein
MKFTTLIPLRFNDGRDESRRISVSCANRHLWEAQQTVIRIGKELGQKGMYFEVRDYDGVQILEVPAD